MENRIILLIIALLLIGGLIYYFESTKPKISDDLVESEIEIETLITDVNVENVSEESVEETQLSEADLKRIEEKAEKYQRAKELVGPEGFINVDNITIAEHIGKDVVLVDFWTYSCINCQRTLPYLTSWYEKYEDDGFVLIGVHTPEFEFEQDYDNLLEATKKWDITYPVVQDNDKQTWRAYKNRYWPRKYLIDIDGFIVYDHIGEGAYEETEELIQELLKERAEILDVDADISSDVVTYESDKGTVAGKTKEIYFGYDFSRDQFGNTEGWQPDETIEYTLPDVKEKDMFYLDGLWKNNKDNLELAGDTGTIFLKFFAKNINIVAGAESPVNAEIFIDGELIKEITVEEFDLYNLFSGEESSDYELEIRANNGLRAFTFTFG